MHAVWQLLGSLSSWCCSRGVSPRVGVGFLRVLQIPKNMPVDELCYGWVCVCGCAVFPPHTRGFRDRWVTIKLHVCSHGSNPYLTRNSPARFLNFNRTLDTLKYETFVVTSVNEDRRVSRPARFLLKHFNFVQKCKINTYIISLSCSVDSCSI